MHRGIDRAGNAVRFWDGGASKLWLVTGPAEGVDEAPAESEERIDVAGSGSPLRPRRALAAGLRCWRHRTPRPDSLGLTLVLRRLDDEDADALVLRCCELPEAPHRRTGRAVREGLAAGLAGVTARPLAAELSVVDFADDGPSSEDGIRIALTEGITALLVAAYRDGVLPYL